SGGDPYQERVMTRRMAGGGAQVRRSSARGVTLVELLVVMAIIALFAALLLPAVEQVRAGGRGTRGQKNLKQIVLAMQNYESTFKTFPPGLVQWPGPPPNRVSLTYQEPAVLQLVNRQQLQLNSWLYTPDWSWQALLMPNMDQGAVQIDFR